MQPRDVVQRFLTGVGRRSEAESYLRLFRAERPESFAIIAANDDAVRDAADALVVDLVYLARLDLRPVTVVANAEYAEILREWLADDVDCEVVDTPEAAIDAVRRGSLPLLVHPRGRIAALATQLGTRKIVFLGAWRGLEPPEGPLPSIVDVRVDYDALVGSLAPAQAELLELAREIIEEAPHRLTVAVTSPFELLRELFTVRGAGTLIRRGAPIQRFDELGALDLARLTALIDSAFGRRLRPAALERPDSVIYVAGDYQGAAVVSPTALGSYLSKFAVERLAQGDGVGRDLWRALSAEHPRLFWRAREQNPISPWYTAQCEGMVRRPPWCVFWRGVGLEHVQELVAFADAQPDDFASPTLSA